MDRCQLTKWSDIIGWAYKGVVPSKEEKEEEKETKASDGSTGYSRVASLAPLALEYYGKCKSAKSVVDTAIEELVKRVILVLRKMYPSLEFEEGFEGINIVCHGSLLQKSPLFFDLFKKKLNWEMAGDPRQAGMKFIIPTHTANYGAAMYIRNKVCGFFRG